MSEHHAITANDFVLNRRDFLQRTGMGLGMWGLATVLGAGRASGDLATAPTYDSLAPRAPHFPAKAERVLHIFMNGGMSHVDTFDPKPSLQTYAGQKLPMEMLTTERPTGAAFPSPFTFQQYGQIFIMNADGSEKRMLTDSRWEDSMPLLVPAKFL